MENEFVLSGNNDSSSTEQPHQAEQSSNLQRDISPDERSQQRAILIGGIAGAILILALIIGSIFLLASPRTDTARVRDIFIIFMALESIVIGIVLIILVVQLARLINLLQNEIKPILDSTNETVNTLRGTTAFLSDNLVEPVIKLNEYLAALQKLSTIVKPRRKK
jgi:hypothetical protein